MTFCSHLIWKGAVVVMVLVTILSQERGAHTQAAGLQRRGHKGSSSSRRGAGRGKVRLPTWLREVTRRKDAAFDNVQSKTDRVIKELFPQISLVPDLSDYAVVDNCSALFLTPINYTVTDPVTGQSDVIARLTSFRHLLHQGELACHDHLGADVTSLLHNLTEAVDNYVGQVTSVCDEHASPETCDGERRRRRKGERRGRRGRREHGCVPQLCQGNKDDSRERVLILVYQLQCYLHRLASPQPLLCTGQGPRLLENKNKNKNKNKKQRNKKRKPRRKNKKAKKSRRRKALKAVTAAMLKQRSLPAWSVVCEPGKMTLTVVANMTSASKMAGDKSKDAGKNDGKKGDNLERFCPRAV